MSTAPQAPPIENASETARDGAVGGPAVPVSSQTQQAASTLAAASMKVPPPPPPPPHPDPQTSTKLAGTKRAYKDGKPLTDKKSRRLEKNRLSARECRRRKREATENLQREINVLEEENLRLRLQLQIGEEAEDSMKAKQDRLTERIDELLKSGASESEIYATIEDFKEKIADYGRDRRSAIEFHLRNVERLLMPTKTTSVAMRALYGGSGQFSATAAAASTAMEARAVADPALLDQPVVSPVSVNSSDSASENSVVLGASQAPNPALEPKALFQYLVNYLEVTPEQAAALKDSRWVAKELDECLAKSLALLEDLRARLSQCGEDLENEFNNVRSILKPTQAAKFLVWVANNSACIHMLNELWSRVYPQPSEIGTQETQDGKESAADSDDVARQE